MKSKCVFSYFITENADQVDISSLELPIKKSFGKYDIYTDDNTPYISFFDGNIECAIFGLSVNVITGESDNVAKEIMQKCRSSADVVEYEKQLGGKYILLFRNGEHYHIQGDATCSIPIFYNTDGEFVCSSNYQYIKKAKNYPEDAAFSEIRKNGDISQAMPYDITPCREIKQLIPNHYLDVNSRASVRFINTEIKQKSLLVETAADAVMPMIEKLLLFYLQRFKIYCPITSGRDSRVVLAFLLKSRADFSCYTIKHPEHNEKTQDIVVPISLCKKVGVAHKIVEDVVVLDDLKSEMDMILGEGNYSQRTLRIAQTIQTYFGDGAIINGDIIGQVGKCSLHRDIPSVFATPSYFRCKLHNYSNGAKKQLKYWLNEIKSSGEKVNTFDLFSVENRMGRWAGQTSALYNSIGQVNLNIFNSRSIIYIWTAVDRSKRKKSLLHIAMIQKLACELLSVPFEKDKKKIMQISKSNGITYLISSYAKYFIEKRLFSYKKERSSDEKNINSK